MKEFQLSKQKNKKQQQGFTLVELIMVIVLLGILAALGISSFSKTVENSKQITCVENRERLMMVMQGEMAKKTFAYYDLLGDEDSATDQSNLDEILEKYQTNYSIACPHGGNWKLTEHETDWHLDCDLCGGRTVSGPALVPPEDLPSSPAEPTEPPSSSGEASTAPTEPTTEPPSTAAPDVTYRIEYWLEKPNISEAEIDKMKAQTSANRGQSMVGGRVVTKAYFDNMYSETVTIGANETLNITGIREANEKKSGITSFKQKMLLTKEADVTGSANRPAEPYSAVYTQGSQAEATLDGEVKVIEVYYLRNVYTLAFHFKTSVSNLYVVDPNYLNVPGDHILWNQFGEYNKGGVPYYTVRVKLGMDIDDRYPTVFMKDGSLRVTRTGNASLFRGWGALQKSTGGIVNSRFVSTEGSSIGYANVYDTSTRTAIYYETWGTKQVQSYMYHYVESLNQDVADAPQYPNNVVEGSHDEEYLHIDDFLLSKTSAVLGTIVTTTDYPIFELHSKSAPYWASAGDRQITNGIEGFTLYTGAAANTNCSQWNGSRYYQLKNSGNSPQKQDRYFFYKRNSYPFAFYIGGSQVDYQNDQGKSEVKFEDNLDDKVTFKRLPLLEAGSLQRDETVTSWYYDAEFESPMDITSIRMPARELRVYGKLGKSKAALCDSLLEEYEDIFNNPGKYGLTNPNLLDARAVMYKKLNKNWDTIHFSGDNKVYYIQPYYNAATGEIYLYANSKNVESGSWFATYIYDQQAGTWYHGSQFTFANYEWTKVKETMTAKGWQPATVVNDL